MTAPIRFTVGEARDVIERLRTQGVVADMDPVLVAEVITGQADEYAKVCRERDQLQARINTARQDVWPHLTRPGLAGELARHVEAALDPQSEPAA